MAPPPPPPSASPLPTPPTPAPAAPAPVVKPAAAAISEVAAPVEAPASPAAAAAAAWAFDPLPPSHPASSHAVVSLLPSATEIICIIGGRPILVGRNHEDDYPENVTNLPILTGAKTTFTTSADVDVQVSTALAKGESLYTLDAELLNTLKPTVILTQDLCDVCAIDLPTVERIAAKMKPRPKVVTLNPMDLYEVLDNITEVAEAVGLEREAALVRQGLDERVRKAIARGEEKLHRNGGVRPRVLFVEWTTPVYPGGHWTPQLVHLAGATHIIAPAQPDPKDPTRILGAGPSARVPDTSVIPAAAPTHVIVGPCGLDLEASRRETDILYNDKEVGGWFRQVVAQGAKVSVIDGNKMFNRPGPRLVECLEWLVDWIWDEEDETLRIPFPWEEWRAPAVPPPLA
ncbi:hypothetical protein DFJ73DRAFT_962351 [Zopfochytrium polystomum]|nr:hypothetical protein DFJ73DRAFT_962351 [Zopfochytrium polystomum]